MADSNAPERLMVLVPRAGGDEVILTIVPAEVKHVFNHGVLHGNTADAVAFALANEGELTAVRFHLVIGGTLLRDCRITRVSRFIGFTYASDEPASVNSATPPCRKCQSSHPLRRLRPRIESGVRQRSAPPEPARVAGAAGKRGLPG